MAQPPLGMEEGEHWRMGGGANGSRELNDGAGLCEGKDCDDVSIASVSERPPPTRTVALANHDLTERLFWRELFA